MDLRVLEEELKKLGVSIVSSRQETIISIRINGLAGKALDRGLRLCDQLLQEKIKSVIKTNTDPTTKLFTDPTFGPTAEDPQGSAALCKTGTTVPSKGGSPHQLKILGLLKSEKLRWERPEYAADEDGAADGDNQTESGDDDDADSDSFNQRIAPERVFASNASLFTERVSSGDVIQGNLGDCWFLSALSVVATRSDLLEQTFWQGDKCKSKGLFVCKFMKNFVWNYVIIDDRLPVYGFSKTREGKPYFARCRDPNELWVSLIEKAYAKLHHSYEALIGGFVDVALNDLTGMCSEQVILKSGYPGFGEDPFLPAKPQQERGGPFWEKIVRYKSSGSLMGCSIQPAPTSADKSAAPESSAGNGLYFKHAYSLVDAANMKTVKNEQVKLVKLRNPWGMGEWTGPWSDSSDERLQNQDAIEHYFKILKRQVGGNLSKRVFLRLNGKGELKVDELAQEEVVEVNTNDGTFFMSFDAWMQYFTHFFAGIDFPDEWHGRRVEGCWSEANCGGNTTKSTWLNNPRFELVVQERSQFFISLSQEDPRGKEKLKIVPIGFHICSLTVVAANEKAAKREIKEPPAKDDAYYRLYRDKDRVEYKKGIRAEPLPPAIVPGSVIKGIDDDGVPQPAYTFKQAVSVDVTMEPGNYCILPSMYIRTDKDTGKTNVGSFWISVYSNKPKFSLEGGERIVEEEEGDEDERADVGGNNSPVAGPRTSFVSLSRMSGLNSPGKKSESSVSCVESISATDQRRHFENAKEELLAQAKAKGIGLRQLKMEFDKAGAMKKLDMRKKLMSIGFKADDLSDDKINVLFSGLDEAGKGSVDPQRVLNMFEAEIHEDQMACELPEVEDDEVPERVHGEGILSLELRSARDLSVMRPRLPRSSDLQRPTVRFSAIEFSASLVKQRKLCAFTVCESNPSLAASVRPVLRRNGWLPASMESKARLQPSTGAPSDPVAQFYGLVDEKFKQQQKMSSVRDLEQELDIPLDNFKSRSGVALVSTDPVSRSSMAPKYAVDSTQVLHKSTRMQTLEEKRCRRLANLKKKKQETLGDRSKAASLPRLIGGRKSGSTYVQCTDCDQRVLVPGRASESSNSNSSSRTSSATAPESYVCAGSRCFNALCASCYLTLPKGKKVCEECYENELTPVEAFGSRLRTLLIEKIGNSSDQRAQVEAFFQSIDKDKSGALSYDEFSSALNSFEIQPPLTVDQLQSLMEQFDANKDGEISLPEFQQWLFQDQVWQPAIGAVVEAAQDSRALVVSPEVRAAVIDPLVEFLLESAFQAHLVSSSTSQWMVTTNSTAPHAMKAKIEPDAQRNQEPDVGAVIFQRVHPITMAASAESESGGVLESSIDQVFERYDADRSGHIDGHEFREMLAALGLQLSEDDARLLMRRVESAATRDETVDLSEFRCYVENLMGNSQTSHSSRQVGYPLVQQILSLEGIVTSDANKRDCIQDIVQQLHWNMRNAEAIRMASALRRHARVKMSVCEIQRLANTLHFREVVPTTFASSQPPAKQDPTLTDPDKLLELNNSGDILNYFLFTAPAALSALLKTFALNTVCHQIGSHLEGVTKTTSAEGIWRSVFGATSTFEPIDQRVFVDRLILSGFTISADSLGSGISSHRLATKLAVAMALDALRCEIDVAKANDEWSWSVSFGLFTVLLQHSKIDTIERKFAHALRSYMQMCVGTQSYLIELALVENDLVLRAVDPAHKYRMEFVLRSDEFSRRAIAQLGHSVWPRERNSSGGRHAAFVKDPNGLLTAPTHPSLHAAILGLLSRLRIRVEATMSSQHTMTPYLTLVEDEVFLHTLETMFARARLPFFWSVTPTTLEFSIDSDYLAQMRRVSFHQLIAELLSKKPAAKPLHSLLTFTNSSLTVRYEIVGQSAVFESTWADFQALLSGHQNTFAVLELCPQGDSFVTKVDRTGGNGAPTWNWKQQIALNEPTRVDHRLDRPIVFTDTVRVSAVPDGSSLKRISFSPVGGGKAASVGHFVVLSVRKALPEKHDETARLYCTAYDPFTSSDFAVDGCPTNWSPDFFNATIHPDFEARWLDAVKEMSLGPGLTPKVLVKVYTKHTKVETLIGECEVSIASAIAHEGHIFDDWFTLQHPSNPSRTAGAVNLAFHFDAKKAKAQCSPLAAAVQPSMKRLNADKTDEGRAPKSLASGASERRRLEELEARLQQSEAATHEALEQARQMKAQLVRQASAPPRNGASTEDANEVLRWKSKLEQVRREQEAQQAEHAKRLAAVQADFHRLELEQRERREEERAVAPVVMMLSNLRQAALGAEASAHDLLSVMKDILTNRSADRPYNGLKKAMAAVADEPGKVSVAAFDDVLDDFGLGLPTPHRKCLLSLLDPETRGRVKIEDFFIKLCGDADLNPVIPQPKPRSIASPLEETPLYEPITVLAPASPTRPAASATLPAPTRPHKMSWKEMKKMLLLNLPEGWEARYTEKGRPYFCNHDNRSTQWKHPVAEVDTKYAEWVKENGANFQRPLSSTTLPRK